jgi:hypothetical protein
VDTVAVDQRTVEVGLSARWIFGKLEVIPSLKYINVQRGETHLDNYRAMLRVIRVF